MKNRQIFSLIILAAFSLLALAATFPERFNVLVNGSGVVVSPANFAASNSLATTQQLVSATNGLLSSAEASSTYATLVGLTNATQNLATAASVVAATNGLLSSASVGTTVQGYSANLSQIATNPPTAGVVLVGNGSTWSPVSTNGLGGSGTVAKRSIYYFTNQISTTATIPFDTSIPQISEGYGVTTNSYTPISTNSTIFVSWQSYVTSSGVFAVTGALFRNSETNCIGVNCEVIESAARSRTLTVRSLPITNTSTSPINFSINVGGASASITYVNQNGATLGVYGGRLVAWMVVEEIPN